MGSPERPSLRNETRVFLENLPVDVRKDEIDKEFSLYGRIAKVYLIYDPPGSGFVEYFEPSAAEFAATSMNGADFLGSKLKTQLTRGGVHRGRGPYRGGFSSSRGRGYSGGGGYGDRDSGSYSGGSRGRGGGFRGGQRGGFDSRGRGRGGGGSFGNSRGYGGSRGSYSKGFSGGGFSRGGGRSYSRGEGSSRGFSSRFSNDGYRGGSSRYDDDDMGQNGYDKYDKFSKYERFGGGKSYDKSESGYSKYPSYGGGARKESYPRSRSPLDVSPEGYRPSSPYQRRSRSPYARPVRDTFSSRNYGESQKSMSPSDREVFRRPRSKSSRSYSSDQDLPSHSYGEKDYLSSSYGSRRSPMDQRY